MTTIKTLAVLGCASLILGGCSAWGSSAEKQAASPYLATAVGRIESNDEARQLVAAADGVIESILVRRGDRVSAGQVLLQVDCSQRQAMAMASTAQARQSAAEASLVEAGPRSEERGAAQAALQRSEAQLRGAEQVLERAQALSTRGFVSQRELDAREAERDAARAARDEARARLTQTLSGARQQERSAANAASEARRGEAMAARASARQCALKSPIDGQVLQILRREGEFSGASQGAVLLVVGDLSRRIVRAEIGERDIAKVREGAPAEVWIEGGGQRWRGKVGEMAALMGRRSARSLDPTDRFDRDVREAIIEVTDQGLPQVVGLRVTVGFPR